MTKCLRRPFTVPTRRPLLARRPLIALAGGTLVAGCGGGWLGDDEDPPLPGTRIPVLLLDEAPEADPQVQGVAISLPAPVLNPQWPQTGLSAAHNPQHLEAGDTLELLWRSDIGEGTSEDGFLMAQPLLANNLLLATDAGGRLTALDPATGDELWRFSPEGGLTTDRLRGAGIAHDGERIYITYSEGLVLALDPATQTELWRRRVLAPLRAAPAVAGGRVLVPTADNQLLALDGETGQILWRHAGFFEQAGILGGAVPASDGNTVIVTYSSGEVFALSLRDGQQIWSDTVQRPRRTLAIDSILDIAGEPVIDGDRVLISGTGGEMAAIELAFGNRLWEASITSLEMPWVAGNFVYVMTDRGELVAMLRENGLIRWVSPVQQSEEIAEGSIERITWHGPALVGDRLLVGNSRGTLLSVSPYTGEILGRVDAPGPIAHTPVAAGGRVFVLTENATLAAYG